MGNSSPLSPVVSPGGTPTVVTSIALARDLNDRVKSTVEKLADITGKEKLEILQVPYSNFDKDFNINIRWDIIGITNLRLITIKECKCKTHKLSNIIWAENCRGEYSSKCTMLVIQLKDDEQLKFNVDYEDAAKFLMNYITDKIKSTTQV